MKRIFEPRKLEPTEFFRLKVVRFVSRSALGSCVVFWYRGGTLFVSFLYLMAVEEIFHQEWSPGIGDPTIFGWFTVFAYLLVAILALGRMRADSDDDLCCSGLWLLLAMAMIFLAINKQLDLQSWLTASLKEHALINGWYEDRRSYQSLFITWLAVLAAGLFGILLWVARKRWRDFVVAGFGFGLLLVFVLSRASSFHHVDTLIDTNILGFRLNSLFELGGIFLTGYGTRHSAEKYDDEWVD